MSTRSSYDSDYEDIDNSYEDDDDYDAYDDDEEKGSIDSEEETNIKKFNLALAFDDDDEIEEMFEEYDQDGSHAIDFDEFCAMLESSYLD